MNFRAIFPIVDFKDEFNFDDCQSNEDFIRAIVNIYFAHTDSRVKEASLSVYMAYRDHYPSYLKPITAAECKQLNEAVDQSTGKIIKLRRIALSALSKVA